MASQDKPDFGRPEAAPQRQLPVAIINDAAAVSFFRAKHSWRHVQRIRQDFPVPHEPDNGHNRKSAAHWAKNGCPEGKKANAQRRTVKVDPTPFVEVGGEGVGKLVDGGQLQRFALLRTAQRHAGPSCVHIEAHGRIFLSCVRRKNGLTSAPSALRPMRTGRKVGCTNHANLVNAIDRPGVGGADRPNDEHWDVALSYVLLNGCLKHIAPKRKVVFLLDRQTAPDEPENQRSFAPDPASRSDRSGELES